MERILHLIQAPLAWILHALCGLAVLFAVVVAFALAVVFARVRRDEDALDAAVDEDAAITQHAEEDETDNKERRWFIDLGPEGQARMITRVVAQQPCMPDPIFQRRAPSGYARYRQ